MTKSERHRAIRQIIGSTEVRTHDELNEALHKRGVRVTQATLSRDLTELGVSRVHTEHGVKYTIPQSATPAALRNFAGFEILHIEANESLVLIRTLAGHAHAVGGYLDSTQNTDILGTIAGDDTVLVVPVSKTKTKQVKKFIQQLLS